MFSLAFKTTTLDQQRLFSSAIAKLIDDIAYVFEVHRRIHYDRPWLNAEAHRTRSNLAKGYAEPRRQA